jgi:hypothetical protein
MNFYPYLTPSRRPDPALLSLVSLGFLSVLLPHVSRQRWSYGRIAIAILANRLLGRLRLHFWINESVNHLA